MDDFGIKHQNKKDVEELLEILKNHCDITVDWMGSKYVGLTIDWEYNKGRVHLSMPGHIAKAIKGLKVKHHLKSNILSIHTKYLLLEQSNNLQKKKRKQTC